MTPHTRTAASSPASTATNADLDSRQAHLETTSETETDAGLIEAQLIEEVSIDGLCGVY